MSPRLLVEDLSDAQIEAIERRMKDPVFSTAGFLGPDESLRDVIREDGRTLRALGVSHERIAGRLEELCEEGEIEDERWRRSEIDSPEEGFLRDFPTLTGPLDTWLEQLACVYEKAGALSDFRLVLDSMRRLTLPSGFEFACARYKGWQSCPFDGEDDGAPSSCGVTGSDFLIGNPRRREQIVFSGLLPHLIEAHHFFEGHGTIYRLDPALAVRVLDLDR